MSAPGEANGTYRTVKLAREALERQGFKCLKGNRYRVVRDQLVYDAHVDISDPLKKVVVRITRQGKLKVKRGGKKGVKTSDGSAGVSKESTLDSEDTTLLREAE